MTRNTIRVPPNPRWIIGGFVITGLAVLVLVGLLFMKQSTTGPLSLKQADTALTSGQLKEAATRYTALLEDAAVSPEQRELIQARMKLVNELVEIRALGQQEGRYATAMGLLDQIAQKRPRLAPLLDSEKSALTVHRDEKAQLLVSQAEKSLRFRAE